MLAHSRIPVEKRRIGDIQDWTDVENRFDHIFMLGLVTYLEHNSSPEPPRMGAPAFATHRDTGHQFYQ